SLAAVHIGAMDNASAYGAEDCSVGLTNGMLSILSCADQSPISKTSFKMIPTIFLLLLLLKFSRTAINHLRIHVMSWRLPGPWGLPIFGSIHKLYEGSHVGLKWFLQEADRLRREGKNIVVFNICGRIYTIPITSSSAKEMLESTDLLTKGRDYDFIRPWLQKGLITSDGNYWKAHRKMLTPTFHFTQLHKYLEHFNRHSRILVEILREKTGNKFDVYPYLKRCALDIICESTLGQCYNMQHQTNHTYVVAVELFNKYVQRYSSEIHMWIPPLWYLLHDFEVRCLLKDLKDFTWKAIRQRISKREDGTIQNEDRTAFLDKLLDMLDRNELTREEVQEEVDTIVFAGHDTTSTTLGWFLWCMATNPQRQQQLHEEIDSVLPDSTEDIAAADLTNLPLLDRCIKESMRVYATAPFTERLVERDIVIDGYTIPAGSEIFLSPMMLHHNSTVYPEDWKYDPDRFLPENVAERSVYDFVPFSAGPRNCIGQKFAILEVKVVAAIIMRAFRVSSTEQMTDNTPAPEVILRPMNGIPITFHERV
ncbi:hypothetical protein PENTCL1PPCAC_29983, partial [Pristionchus entomophagus]